MVFYLRYKHYVLVLLTIVAAFNYLDRVVLSLVIEPLKQELQLSDSQIGLMTGLAFAIFYATAGIPIARWADRGNRNTVVSITTALWSAMVAVCGLVGNYNQLLLVRVGVAVGEAGCIPPGQSLIADYYDRAQRPRAMALYSLSGPLALFFGYLVGSWLLDLFGWRATFIFIGLPGVLVAVLVRYTLREPRVQTGLTLQPNQHSIKEVFQVLWQQRAFRHILVAFCINYFFSNGITQWTPTFFFRSYAMDLVDLGSWLAVIYGAGTLFGNLLGAYITTRFFACKEALQMRAISIVYVISGFFFLIIYLSDSQYLSLTFLGVTWLLINLCAGATMAAVQSLVSSDMRSMAFALILLFANLIGFGLGPLAIGAISDLLSANYGVESLRYALVLATPCAWWAAVHFLSSSNTIEKDIAAIERQAQRRIKHDIDIKNKKRDVGSEFNSC